MPEVTERFFFFFLANSPPFQESCQSLGRKSELIFSKDRVRQVHTEPRRVSVGLGTCSVSRMRRVPEEGNHMTWQATPGMSVELTAVASPAPAPHRMLAWHVSSAPPRAPSTWKSGFGPRLRSCPKLPMVISPTNSRLGHLALMCSTTATISAGGRPCLPSQKETEDT